VYAMPVLVLRDQKKSNGSGGKLGSGGTLAFGSGGTSQRLCDGREFPFGSPRSDHHPTGINPRRDGERIAVACWLRLPSDGDKPHRNEELKPGPAWCFIRARNNASEQDIGVRNACPCSLLARSCSLVVLAF
jgi:hypothetical protein